MGEHRMHATIFLTEVSLVMFALLDIVNLHTIITFRGEKKSPFIVKVDRENRRRARSLFTGSGWITTKMLCYDQLLILH